MLTAGGLRVGVIGATDYYPQYDSFGLAERGRVTAVRREADLLRAQGADVVILLSHCGIHHDRGLSWALRGKVDLVVGGHTHDVLTEGERAHGIPIAQAGCHAEYLGRVTLEVDDDGARVVSTTLEPVAEDAPEDPAVAAELAACERDLEVWLAEPVGSLDSAVGCSHEGESDVANLAAEALLTHRAGDLAVLIAAQCTAGLPKGEVTRGDVWTATSSPANPATATLLGSELRTMITKGLSPAYASTVSRTFRGRPYGYLHLAGARVEDGQITVAGVPLEDDRRYKVTGTDTELSSYGLLLAEDPADLEIHTPTILPELLESYLAGHS